MFLVKEWFDALSWRYWAYKHYLIFIKSGNVISSLISRQMLEQDLLRQEQENSFSGFSEGIPFELILFDPGPMSVKGMMSAYNVSLDIVSILLFFGSGISVIFMSAIIPLVYIMRLKPKNILLSSSS